MPALFRRRAVWLPTIWGALAGVVVLAAAALAFVAWIGPHLARSAPVRGPGGPGARTLVVEGWLREAELDAAVAAFRRGRYERVVVSGGPIEDWAEGRRFGSYAERAADYLSRHGLAAVPVVAVPAPASAQDRTYLSAVMVRDWLEKDGAASAPIDLFSSGVHARRSQIVYRMAFGPAVEIGVIAAAPIDYDPGRWWTTSAGAKAVLGEAIGVAWTRCCFWPAARGSFSERWAVPAPQ